MINNTEKLSTSQLCRSWDNFIYKLDFFDQSSLYCNQVLPVYNQYRTKKKMNPIILSSKNLRVKDSLGRIGFACSYWDFAPRDYTLWSFKKHPKFGMYLSVYASLKVFKTFLNDKGVLSFNGTLDFISKVKRIFNKDLNYDQAEAILNLAIFYAGDQLSFDCKVDNKMQEILELGIKYLGE